MSSDNYTHIHTEPSGVQRADVWRMFDRIAPTYDLVNRLLSFGLDIRWRKTVATHMPKERDMVLLDLATGTGDQVISLVKSGRFNEAVGMDMSAGMLEKGREKVLQLGLSDTISMLDGDATSMPLEDSRFDAVTISFGIRNVVHVDKALAEMCRVLKPGGRAIILEFSLPKSAIVRAGHLFYLRHILPLVGGLVSGDRDAYRYLNTTIEAFPYGQAFCDLMTTAGFSSATAHRLTFGIATIYVGVR
ncbi:MAG: bifunctional demethylmenaquinone methyltransferase/2-methoxy-6-polyprenyl-1,4-benzoquinol methylase UbiE [Myxococcota bacterium]|nr:bifunctional demethylmenaquinone methyltransferase/2-methoxy-6-polyprenyl-1,4-benzoquinol methylase UbiE [Myxococcota bacterium]